jgi:DNA-binding FadR family transcriptional regulator
LVARLAAERATPEQIARLETLISGLPKDYDFVGDAETDRKFHQILVEASHNRHLVDIAERLYSQSVRLAYLRPSANPFSEVLEEYWEMLAALRGRDPERAEAAMERHIVRGKQKINFPGA